VIQLKRTESSTYLPQFFAFLVLLGAIIGGFVWQ